MESSPALAPGTRTCLDGGGHMGELARRTDWAATPLGDVSTWPQSLRTTVSTCLSSRFPILVWWGRDLVKIYNDAYMPVLGAKHPRALGQRGRDCWPEIWHIIGPMLEGVLERGEATWSEDQMLPLARHGFVEECYFTFSYSPIRDESGGVGGVFTAVTETTERVLAERRLETLRELAAGDASAATDEEACAHAAAVLARNAADIPFAMVFLVDPKGRRAVCVRTVGLPKDAAAAPPSIERDDERPLWPVWEALAAQKAVVVDDVETRCGPLPGGPWEESPARAVAVPIARPGQDLPYGVVVFGSSPRRPLDASYESFFGLVAGHVARAIANARVHQEERRRADALAALDRAKTRFFSDVSHELRTPLTLVLAPLEDLLQAPALPPADQERIALAHRSALRLLRLVSTLLDFSRIEAGRSDACFEEVDLAEVTRDLASSFRSAVERAGVRLVIACERPPAPVFVDRDAWEKIVLNLLSNATKHTFEGAITVRLSGDEQRVVLTVADTGVGIPERELPRIFERFYRVRDARSRSHEGTGIGLALVQELVKLHAGTIHVESVEGGGTTFSVELPTGCAHLPAERVGARRALASTATGAVPYVEEAARWIAPRAPGAASAPQAIAPEEERRRARILLADDNADMRDYLARLLREHWDVEAVPDGGAALRAAMERPPSLVLADVMMPELDGFALLRALKTNRRTRSVPIVLLSARAGEEATVEGLAAGADDYLVKPFSARELVARVAANLAAARVRAEEVERKDAFLAMLGHELRNPLAALSMAVQMLRRAPDRFDRALSLAERQVAQMARLLDDLSEASRLARGVVDLRRRRLHVGSAIQNAIESVRPLVERKRHRVVERCAEDAWVDADPARLEQILTNVLTNAAKYQDTGGEIAIEAARDAGNVVIRVRDRGVGVAPELLARIFDPFVQADQPLDRRDGGLGIGLTLVQSLVELHGGAVCARSEGLGRGCEIEIRLPASGADAEVEAASAFAPTAPARSRRVLVVDDNVDAAEMTRDYLVEHGYEVLVATDGLEALDVLARERPDVALLDLGLPRLDGYALARRARAMPGLARTRFVAMSGYGSVEHRRESHAAGFDAHLVKPVAPAALLEVLDAS